MYIFPKFDIYDTVMLVCSGASFIVGLFNVFYHQVKVACNLRSSQGYVYCLTITRSSYFVNVVKVKSSIMEQK